MDVEINAKDVVGAHIVAIPIVLLNVVRFVLADARAYVPDVWKNVTMDADLGVMDVNQHAPGNVRDSVEDVEASVRMLVKEIVVRDVQVIVHRIVEWLVRNLVAEIV